MYDIWLCPWAGTPIIVLTTDDVRVARAGFYAYAGTAEPATHYIGFVSDPATGAWDFTTRDRDWPQMLDEATYGVTV